MKLDHKMMYLFYKPLGEWRAISLKRAIRGMIAQSYYSPTNL